MLIPLTRVWTQSLIERLPGIVRINGRVLILADGIKKSKEGRKMPAVKRLHQESESNTKPKYINGHSIQSAAILAKGLSSFIAYR